MKDVGARPVRGAVTADAESELHGSAEPPDLTHAQPARPGAVPSLDDTAGMIGQTINKYRIVRKLGQGGMGMVFEAVHTGIGQRAVVKLLRPHISQDPRYVERFFNEARAATIAQHASLVKVFDFGQAPSGALYMLMEQLEGETLRARLLRSNCLPTAEALRLTRQIASAMAVVHARGIYHRDLKPENIFIVSDIEAAAGERAKILDFGLARIDDALEPGARQTGSNAIAGTPAYMAPEQCRGLGQADSAADVYALGVMLYEMLAGQTPFVGELPGDLFILHIQKDPPPLESRSSQVPRELARLTHRMLRKAQSERPSMQDIERELQAMEPQLPVAATYPGDAPRPLIRSSSISLRVLRGHRLIKLAAAGLSATLLVAAAGRFLLGPSLRTLLPGAQDPSMVTLRGGTFTMGSTEVEIEAAFYWCQQLSPTPCHRDQFERELPAHRVTVSAFELDATEVTNQQFASWLNQRRDLTIDPEHGRLVSAGGVLYVDLFPMYAQGGLAYVGSKFRALQGYERRPVTQVTWDAAVAYCAAHGKRLPTEAEWEFAARATESNRFPWGFEEPRCDGVVISRNKGQACAHAGLGPAAVGTATQDRSAQGVFDLAGNVAEWVQDSFEARYIPGNDGSCVNPLVTTKPSSPHPELRMVRGSDWSALAVFGRAAARSRLPQDRTAGNIGFRCARSRSQSPSGASSTGTSG